MVELTKKHLHLALNFAWEAHKWQVDKGGEPYIFHPLRVSLKFGDLKLRIIALLHDVVEDSDIKLEQIEIEFGSEVAEAVDYLSRRSGETYWEYIERMKSNNLAINIKIADIEDNLLPSRIESINSKLILRYKKVLQVIGGK